MSNINLKEILFQESEKNQEKYKKSLCAELKKAKDCPYCLCKVDPKIRYLLEKNIENQDIEKILSVKDSKLELEVRERQDKISDKINEHFDNEIKYNLSKDELSILKEIRIHKLSQLILECSNCGYIFLENYLLYGPDNDYFGEGEDDIYWELCSKYPDNRIYFSEEIDQISPRFSKYFKEAEIIYSQGLLNSSGPIYRKALEYLIKDYAIINNPRKKGEIKNEELFQSINKYISNEEIKGCAHKVRILGNLDVHYQELDKEPTEKDIEILREFIYLTIYWFEQTLKTKRLLSQFRSRVNP